LLTFISTRALLSKEIHLSNNQSTQGSVSVLEPLTVVADQSTFGWGNDSTLLLKVDNDDESSKNICMMITVQVSNFFSSKHSCVVHWETCSYDYICLWCSTNWLLASDAWSQYKSNLI